MREIDLWRKAQARKEKASDAWASEVIYYEEQYSYGEAPYIPHEMWQYISQVKRAYERLHGVVLEMPAE